MAQKRRLMLAGPKAKEKAYAGAQYLVNAVKLTIGPYGRNFASGVHGGPIAISNDGVSLAKEIEGRDEFEDIGVRAVREAATKTNDAAGDGTTSAMVLAGAILNVTDFDPEMGIPKFPPVQIAEQLRQESEEVVARLEALAKPVESRAHLIAVAKVSVENDALAELIGGAQWDVGADGTVLVEEHNAPTDEVEFVNGIRWDNGFTSSRIINNQERQSLELTGVHVLLTNKIFNTAKSLQDLMPLYKQLADAGSQGLVIFGRAFDDTAVGWCVRNIAAFAEGKGGLPVYPINAPYTDQDNVMEDIAASIGGKYINANERNPETAMLADAGVANRFTVKRFEGVVVGPKRGDDERIDKMVDKRFEFISEKLKGNVSPFEKRALQSRQSQLKTGTAIVRIGAETEQELRYKKDKADDAVNAVRSAIQDGVVPGAGLALVKVAEEMEQAAKDANKPMPRITPALRAPYQCIMANAGKDFEVPESVEDPLRVVKIAFQKASSIARSLSTTEVLTNWEKEKPLYLAPGAVTTQAEESTYNNMYDEQ